MLRTSIFFPNQPVRPGWPEIWATALTQPNIATYRALARRAAIRTQVASVWLFNSSLLGGLLISWRALLITSDHRLASGLLLAIPLYALLALGSWLVFAFCTQWVANRLHGQGSYVRSLATFASFSAPLTLITSLFSLLPYHQLPTLCLYGYWFMLYLLSIKAVNRFSWQRAVGTLLLTLGLCATLLFGIVLLLVYGFSG